MDFEPDLPGSCSPRSPTSPKSWKGSQQNSPNKLNLHRRRGKGLHVRIWEYGGTSWIESHIYSHWLEADCAADGDHMDVHLPSLSVQGIMQLRGCLDHPKALCLDPPAHGSTEDSFLWDAFCSQLDGPIAVEARRVLEKRRSPSKAKPLEPTRPKSPALEMMQPEAGAECMDISICALEGLQKGCNPTLLLLRCGKPLNSLRYAALVACPRSGGAQALHAAREVAKALATAFVDERFVHEVSRVPAELPSHVVEAFDRFLSTLTIVPTVHLREQGSTRPGTSQHSPTECSAPASCSDVLLADSLQYQMESLLCNSLGVCQPPRRSKSRVEEFSIGYDWKRCFVEVDCLDIATQEWNMTHQLRQGMEIDAGSCKKPHLPHVSAVGLSKIRGLSAPNNVALDVMASNGTAAVDAIVKQLGQAGLPSSAAETVASALRIRATEGTAGRIPVPEPLSPDVRRAESFFTAAQGHQTDLVAPCEEDDAFLILLVPSEDVPASVGITSACLRFSIPIEFAQCETPVRFLVVLVGPVGAAEEMSQAGNSLAALAVDEDLVGSLDKAVDEASFAAAMSRRLDDLPVMPRSHLEGRHHHSHHHQHVKKVSTGSKGSSSIGNADRSSKVKSQESETVIQDHVAEEMHGQGPSTMSRCRRTWVSAVKKIQKYSLPLVSGVLLALIWANVDDHSYHDVIHGYFSDDFSISGHKISLHFIVNDMFMCLFFGLAIKEVTEALLPGGSLSPLRRAANPLCATCGGIIGPIACYFIVTLVMDAFGAFDDLECQVEVDGRRLGGGGGAVQFTGETAPCELSAILNGWGVPTATDISLAWMFALLIFGPGHPAINFLLLLAIVDDAIGMVIIAIFYGDKDKPFYEGKEWLVLVVGAALLAYILRRLRVRQWPVFILVCGPVSWIGLLKAHVHPALALVVVVPFMPATVARRRSSDHRGLGAWSSSDEASQAKQASQAMKGMLKRTGAVDGNLGGRSKGTMMLFNMVDFLQNQENAPLHLFEHDLKLPVDIGMFFFGLANAGVKLGSVGGVTTCVLTSLIVGKTLGVAGFAILAHCCGFGLPDGIVMSDLFAMGALAGVGLTVALFVSNEAFSDPGLQGQAKMGALLSIGSAGISWLISVIHKKFCQEPHLKSAADAEDSDDDEDEGDDDGFEEVVTHELIQQMWEFRRYKARGHELTIEQMARSVSKNVRQISKNDRTFSGEGIGAADNLVRQISTGSGGSRQPVSARRSKALEKLGPTRSERRRSSRKHASWATTHLRPPGDGPTPPGTPGVLQ